MLSGERIASRVAPIPLASKSHDGDDESCEESGGISRVSPSDADRFYTYLGTRTVVQLRTRLRELGQPQKGEKRALALRVFGKVAADVGEDGDWVKEGGVRYEEWACSPEGQLTTWNAAPCATELSGVALRASNSPAACAAFSVADFQRMCFILTQDEEVRRTLIASGQNLSRGQLDAGVRRDDFWCTTVAPRYNDAAIKPPFSEIPFSASESIDGENWTSEMTPNTFRLVPRTGEDLRLNFFRVRSLFSECHRRWSLSGQMDPEAFPNFLPARPGGRPSNDGQKAMILFRALRCGEPGEDTEVLNFTNKIAPEGARIELGANESPDKPISTLSARPRKRKADKGERGLDEEEGLLDVMNKVAESMPAGSSAANDYSMKRSRLGEQRKAETESLMKLLSQKRDLRETGLSAEDPEIMEELEVEIKCCKDRLRHFRKEEEELT
jgi:hypothetical protein